MKIPENYTQWHEHMDANTCIIWDQYGYWQENGTHFVAKPPDWFTSEEIKKAENFAARVVTPEMRIIFEVSEDGEHGEWATVDDANKIVYFHSRVKAKNPKSYMRDLHTTHCHLYVGIIEALIVYQKTGISCLPDWNTDKIDSYGYKDGKKYRIPRVKEVLANQ